MAPKPRPTSGKPPSHTDEEASNDSRGSSTERRRPPEPFEECGPSGGYGGAGTDETEKDD
jgi:hypothetical protein